jgi:hypothetical protein
MRGRVLLVSIGLVLGLGFHSAAHAQGRSLNFPAARIQVDVPDEWGWTTGNDGAVTFVDSSKEFLLIAQTMDGANMLGALAGVHILLNLLLTRYDCDEPSASAHRGMATITMECVGRLEQRRLHVLTRVFDSPQKYFLELVLASDSVTEDQSDSIRSFMRSTRPMRR